MKKLTCKDLEQVIAGSGLEGSNNTLELDGQINDDHLADDKTGTQTGDGSTDGTPIA